MMQSKEGFTVNRTITVLFSLLILAVIFTSRFPSFFSIGGRDTGCYANVAYEVLNGNVLYRDIWDHKPPLMHYLNATLFGLFGSNFRTIAVFEVFWILFTCMFFYGLSSLIFRKKVSLFLTFVFATYASSRNMAQSFGMTETYALLPSIIAVLAAIRYTESPKRSLLFISGAMVSASFLFRQTEAVVAVPILLYLLIKAGPARKAISRQLFNLAVFSAGFLVPAALFAIYFFLKDAWIDAFSQVFLYNRMTLMVNRIPAPSAIWELIRHTLQESFLAARPYLLIFGVTGILFKVVDFAKGIGKTGLRKSLLEHSLFILVFSWFAADLYCVSLSGLYYGHYYMQALPSLTLLAGFAIQDLSDYFKNFLKLAFFISFLYLALSPLAYDIHESSLYLYNLLRHTDSSNSVYIDGIRYRCPQLPVNMVRWIMANTSEGDYLYFWGRESGLNFLTKRRSPSKYASLSPLRETGYATAYDSVRFMKDLEEKMPKFIIDTSSENNDIRSLDDPRGWQGTFLCDGMNYIKNHYAYYKTIDGWDIYRRDNEDR